MVMRALTYQQPWAGLSAAGIKLAENRSRPIAPRELFGNRFAIHAGLATDEAAPHKLALAAPDLFADTDSNRHWWELSKIHGAVIGVARLRDALYIGGNSEATTMRMLERFGIADQRRFVIGPTVYVLAEVVQLFPPIPCRGRQGFWTLPYDVELQVVEQLR